MKQVRIAELKSRLSEHLDAVRRGETIEVVGWVDDPDHYPMQPKRHTMEYLREVAHLRPRTNVIGAVTRVRHTLAMAVHRFFDQHGFFWIHTPIITASDAEGAGQMFRVSTLDFANLPKTADGKIDFDKDFFGKEARLTVSGQLNVETYAMALSRVYTFGPTFRAEKSKTRRHLMEFWMVEPEVAFLEFEGLQSLAEEFVEYLVTRALDRCQEELKTLERDQSKLENVKRPFPRITYREAIDLLASKGMEAKFGDDLGGDEETVIANSFDRPVMISRYPTDIKAFYMQPDPADPTKALCVDVLAPEGYGEIIGGSQRVDSYDLLKSRIEEHGLPLDAFQWYLDLRKYGSVPHAGFGMGIERVVAWICGLDHVRETIPFARTLNRIYP